VKCYKIEQFTLGGDLKMAKQVIVFSQPG